MFEKIGQAAERVAAKVSRRDILGQFGKSALAVASLLAGLFAFPSSVEASPARYKCCLYQRGRFCWPANLNCPPTSGCGTLVGTDLSGCSRCPKSPCVGGA